MKYSAKIPKILVFFAALDKESQMQYPCIGESIPRKAENRHEIDRRNAASRCTAAANRGAGAPDQRNRPCAPAAAASAPAPAAEEKRLSGKIIKSPIVGTFYASPSPDQPPFVQVGDTVKKGDVIMIIESMKLMNEVQSDMDGTVQEILVKNGEAVEYDQPLMILA